MGALERQHVDRNYEQVWAQLLDAQESYLTEVSPDYDQVLHEVSARVSDTGSIGKSDIGALLFWKRLRANTPWVGELLALPEVEVRSATIEAVRAVNDISISLGVAASQGRSWLTSLPGFNKGDAMASALLLAAAPRRMAVYDRRAQAALTHLGLKLTAAPGRYGRYLALIEDLLQHKPERAAGWLPRDVDTALYWLGGNTSTSKRP